MSMLYVVLSTVYILACLFLCFVVLIQKGEGGGLGGAFGGGAVDVAFGAKADMTWKRATAVAAGLFMVLAIVIGIWDNQRGGGTITDAGQEPAAEEPADGGAGAAGEGEDVTEELSQPGVADDSTGTLREESPEEAGGGAPADGGGGAGEGASGGGDGGAAGEGSGEE